MNHIYFSGIGGVGIGPLAMLALDAGYSVQGSDLHESPIVTELRERGVQITISQQDETAISAIHNQRPVDWFIHSAAVTEDNPEFVFAKNNSIKISKRDEFLNHFLEERNLEMIAVAGTHGKTTTTSMVVWLAKQFNIPISYSVGTTLSFGPAAQYENGSKYFVYECDEFDRNFLHFKPAVGLITSMDYDHPDTYPTQELYSQAFKEFSTGCKKLFIWQEVAQKLGLTQSESITVLNKQDPAIKNIQLAGTHMRENAWIAGNGAHTIVANQTVEMLSELLKAFPGSSRRFEKLADGLYTDYAHHPVEIAATIEMAKELSRNVVVVYQPHQNIRQHEIVRENAYLHCFSGIDKLYWLPTYLSREQKDLPVLSPTELMVSIGPDISVEYDEMNDTLWQKIHGHLRHGDLVIAMSAGDLDSWLRGKAPPQA